MSAFMLIAVPAVAEPLAASLEGARERPLRGVHTQVRRQTRRIGELLGTASPPALVSADTDIEMSQASSALAAG